MANTVKSWVLALHGIQHVIMHLSWRKCKDDTEIIRSVHYRWQRKKIPKLFIRSDQLLVCTRRNV